MKKIICLVICFLLVFSLVACKPSELGGGQDEMTREEMLAKWGENYHPENEKADQSFLYGMCYEPPKENNVNNLHNYPLGFEVLNNLGVKSIRLHLQMGSVMSNPTTIREDKVAYIHAILAEAKKYGIQVIGMTHHNYIEGRGFMLAKHKYQPWEGSDYYKWLEDYETSWYTFATEFSEITHWEIDNEINNPGFMCVYGNENGYTPPEEMVAIALDMMLYGSRGIHRANPKAVAIMGSLTDPSSLGIGKGPTKTYDGVGKVTYPTSAEFLEMMYQAIESGAHGSTYPDDFFQAACWHPYYFRNDPSEQYWIDENNKIYEIIKRHEGKDKKVYFTEIGWRVDHNSEEKQALFLKNLYQTVKEQLPYVEAVHYYTFIDPIGHLKKPFGLFYDTDLQISYDGVDVRKGEPGEPRLGAHAYQEVAGGSGPLELFPKK